MHGAARQGTEVSETGRLCTQGRGGNWEPDTDKRHGYFSASASFAKEMSNPMLADCTLFFPKTNSWPAFSCAVSRFLNIAHWYCPIETHTWRQAISRLKAASLWVTCTKSTQNPDAREGRQQNKDIMETRAWVQTLHTHLLCYLTGRFTSLITLS